MNAIKKLFAASLAVSAITGAANAQTTIRIVGSTAYRAAAVTAIENILATGFTYGYAGTSGATKAAQSTFVGTTKVGGLSVVIECSWTGSVGGVQTLAQATPAVTNATFIAPSSSFTSSGVSGISSGYEAPATADISMSDSIQSSTQFSGGNYLQLTDIPVGIVPFVWAKGISQDPTVNAALANVTNITPLQARAMLTNAMPISLLTGNASDSAIDVLPVGRDEDSGTRLDAFAESGFGVFGSPTQYQPMILTGATTISGIAPYQANTVNGISYGVGHSGYSSGGTLATTLNTPVASGLTDSFGNKFALIGYFGTSDAAGVNGGNNNLTYNGVPYSATNVQEGKYTFWSYEHLMYRKTLAGTAFTVANQIAQQILNFDAVQAGLLISSMHVSRQVEGGIVTHN